MPKYLPSEFQTLKLKFNRPQEKDQVKLILRLKNSYWLDYTFGKFYKNELKSIRLVQNTEMIYHLYDEKTKELIGIDKAICSEILMSIENNNIKDITFFTNPEGIVFPEDEIELNEKILNGFNWRINEKINKIKDLFD